MNSVNGLLRGGNNSREDRGYVRFLDIEAFQQKRLRHGLAWHYSEV